MSFYCRVFQASQTGSVVSAVAGCTTGLAIAGLELGKTAGKGNEQYFNAALAFVSVGLAFMMFKRFQVRDFIVLAEWTLETYV